MTETTMVEITEERLQDLERRKVLLRQLLDKKEAEMRLQTFKARQIVNLEGLTDSKALNILKIVIEAIMAESFNN